MSHTTTFSETFSLTNAKYLASKIVTDLELCHQRYGAPSEYAIEKYKEELILLMKDQYLEAYEFGFKTDNDKRVISWKYKIQMYSISGGDDAPGGLYRKANIDDARFYNLITLSDKWFELSDVDRIKVEATLPIQRGDGSEPSDGNGHWKENRSYSSGGCLVTRRSFVPY
jgi:HORMA domain-containing protein